MRQLELELARRKTDTQRVLEIVLSHCVVHPRGKIGLNIVYELVSQNMGRANGPAFKRWVTEILAQELKVYKITQITNGVYTGRVSVNGFRGICTPEYLEWRLAEDAKVKAERCARLVDRKHNRLMQGTESARIIGAMGGRGNTREKRLAREQAEREAQEPKDD